MRIIAVDIGGSGVRICRAESGKTAETKNVNVNSAAELAAQIRSICHSALPDAVGISAAGFVDSKAGYVRLSRAAPWAEGDLAQKMRRLLGVSAVTVMNDCEAHALAMLNDRRVAYGAICLSLGTAVGMGMLDKNRRLTRTLSGENWDIGEWTVKSRATIPQVWWCLGSNGLKELTGSMGEAGYSHYGCRLGGFLSQLAVIFRPNTIALTGGIAHGDHWGEIEQPMREAFAGGIPNYMKAPQIIRLRDQETALTGLVTYLENQLSDHSNLGLPPD